MKKLILVASLLTIAGVASYGQITNIDLTANAAPGTSQDSADQDQGGLLENAWATTIQNNGNNGSFSGDLFSTNDGTGSNTPAGGWDIYAGGGIGYADMYHTFNGNLLSGETISLTLAGGSVQNGGVIGINLVESGGSYPSLFSLYFVGGNSTWSYDNGDLWPGNDGNYNSSAPPSGSSTGASYNYLSTDTFTFTMLDNSGDYSATYGGQTWTGQIAGGADDINAIRVFNNNGGSSSDVVTNNLSVPEPSTIMMLLSSGVLGSFYLLRRRRK